MAKAHCEARWAAPACSGKGFEHNALAGSNRWRSPTKADRTPALVRARAPVEGADSANRDCHFRPNRDVSLTLRRSAATRLSTELPMRNYLR